MIEVEYITDQNKYLFTITFTNYILNHLRVKCDDYLNFYQSQYQVNLLTIFKADTGYKIKRVPNRKKTYQIQIGHKLNFLNEIPLTQTMYFMKKNGFVKIKIQSS